MTTLCYLAAAAGLGWLMVSRWNGVPADPSGAAPGGIFLRPPIDPAWDRTKELTAALATLPPEPPFVLPPPPPGMRWRTAAPLPPFVEVHEALRGEWAPQTRPILHTVIEFLNTPGVESALVQIASVEPGGWRPDDVMGQRSPGLRAVRRAFDLFAARARYRQAGLGDVEGALADLQAARRLAFIQFDSGTLLVVLTGFSGESFANNQLQHLAREQRLSPFQAAQALAGLDASALNLRRMWQHITDAHIAELEHELNLAYTDTGNGEGWLVLSHMNDIAQADWAPEPRCGAWNALSLLFNDRRTVAAKIGYWRRFCEEVGDLPFGEAMGKLEATRGHVLFTVTDGPFCEGRAFAEQVYTYRLVAHAAATRHAAALAVALSLYRHDRGEYPASLGELLNGYLSELPLDPCDDQPLRYRLQDADSYLLYSVGLNRRDDGGKPSTATAAGADVNEPDDWLLNRPRSEPVWEPVLEEVGP